MLPDLVAILPISDTNTEHPVEVTLLCHILNNLSQASVHNTRSLLNHGLLPRIIKLSTKDHRYAIMMPVYQGCRTPWNPQEFGTAAYINIISYVL